MKRLFQYISVALILLMLASCSKDADVIPDIFYGKWKASYGDTIVFSRTNGMNIATYNYSMNPLMPSRGDHEFAYRDGKLGTRLLATSDFHFFNSFRWIQSGQSFEIQGIEWFNFLSSTGTYFTFTRIP